ncbi:DegT/DnrJ/EryC1/StrS family aminotransferase [Streptomyces sp. NPDC102360]|uniref:DegT/DnrJ/EryC1/StrS family aminotransferase n=1 Tax=Streptomyces sp. NPDC102360 TaxID=3366160 RepID=UPI00380FE979
MNARPFLHGPETEALIEALWLGQYGHSRLVEKFEHDIAEFLGVPDMVAVASGTDALHIALLAAEVGPGDEVVVPSQTYCATVQAILATGAQPRFIEINPATLCVEADDVLAAVTPATRVVLPVLYGGRAVDLSALTEVLDSRRITVIEDAAHAFGSVCGDKLVGARREALTCFSFGPIKNLTCGQGGGIVPRTREEAGRLRTLRALGIADSQRQRAQTTTYAVQQYGLRATMSALNAAIGRVQLRYFDAVAALRKSLWQSYADGLSGIGGVEVVDVDVARSVPFNCVVRLVHRDAAFHALRSRGIGVGVHYPPNHLQPAFARWRRSLPVTEESDRQIMSLPFHPAMSSEDVQRVVAAVRETALEAGTCAS